MKSVITCAGKGTRLLPFTKELPKEMAPVFLNGTEGIELKPLLQLIFENLHTVGIKEFCFVTGKTKRSIQDHFHPNVIESSPKQLSNYFDMLRNSTLFWIDQQSPKGFGDAVLPSKSFINNDNFILHAGDVAFLPNYLKPLEDLLDLEKTDVDAAFFVREVEDPERHGIISSSVTNDGFFDVEKIIEKPKSPESNLGVFPIYYFRNNIFDALESTSPGYGGEIQLTDAIQKLIMAGKKVVAKIIPSDFVLDVGTPESYFSAINLSHDAVTKRIC